MQRVFVAAIALFSSFASAQASQAVEWKEVGGWGVYMDPTMGNACYVATVYEGGTILRVGLDFSGDTGLIYMALGNESWKSLEPGKDYPIQIQFDNEAEWTATATGRESNDALWLYVTTDKTGFLDEFSRKLGMRATFRGTDIALLNLKGSSRALTEMLRCQDAVNEAVGATAAKPAPPEDPFAVAPKSKNAADPFDL